MSLPERMKSAVLGSRGALAVTMIAGLAVASGCTVRPLYSDATAVSGPVTGSIGNELAMIDVKPVNTRVGQQVRNELIFLLTGGKGQPDEARYSMVLLVASSSEATANIQVNDENEPTAAILTARANYTITGPDGKVVAKGVRQFSSSYDVPRQEFAAYRARIDAENRAARELAELLRMAAAQDLSRKPAN